MTKTPFAPSHSQEIVPAKISLCLNPACLQPNLKHKKLCQYCGKKLLLSERYRAISYINTGGFAYTFKAVDEHRLDTPCLIKQFVPLQLDGTAREKAINLFEQEAAILKEIGDRPQIPSLLAFLEQEGQLYLVEEFIPGQTLDQILSQTGRFSQQQVQQVLTALLPVLQFIHERQIIHRDLKPSNIILQENGSLALIDFGSCLRLSREFLTRISPITGTPGYAAPEQMRGKVYPASDLYSLGATMMQLLTGVVPLQNELELIPPQLICQQAAVEISPEFAQILEKLLQPEVSDRYQSAVEVLADWERASEVMGETGEHRDILKIQNVAHSHYQQLENLLAAGNYRQADRETWQLMLQISGRKQQGCLTLASVQQFPLPALKQIDRLWQEYSNGYFGLTIQQQIYQSLGGSKDFDYRLWQRFGESVGWYKQGKWLNYSELSFVLSAPVGHLPACCVDAFNRAGIERGVCGWWRLGFVSLMQRLT
jgi:serine/threonine protein kinase